MQKEKELHKHLLEYGNFNNLSLSNYNLFIWVVEKKDLYRHGLVSEDEFKALHKIGINLSKRADGGYEDAAEKMYILEKFRDEYGDNFPNKYKDYEDSRYNGLAQWLSRQRTAFRGGKLSQDIVELLLGSGVELDNAAKVHQLNGALSYKKSSFELNIELLKVVVDTLGPEKNINFSETQKSEKLKKAYNFIDHCKLKARQGILSKEEYDIICAFDFSINEIQIKQVLKPGDSKCKTGVWGRWGNNLKL